jgi:hypothetical protein
MRQLVSAGAVALSLVFLALEVRQNTVMQRAHTRQGLADASREFTLMIATDSVARRVWYAMFQPHLYEGRETPRLSHTDTIQARILLFTNMRNVENVFLQSLEGVIDQSVLGTYAFVHPLYQGESFANLWKDIRPLFDPRFVDAFELANHIQL